MHDCINTVFSGGIDLKCGYTLFREEALVRLDKETPQAQSRAKHLLLLHGEKFFSERGCGSVQALKLS